MKTKFIDAFSQPLVLIPADMSQAADGIGSLVRQVDEQAVLAYGHFIER